MGLGVVRHHPGGPTGQGDRALPGVRGRGRQGHRRLADPPPDARRGVPVDPGPLCPSLRRAPPHRHHRPHPGNGGSEHHHLRPAGRGTGRHRPQGGGRVMERPFAITLDVGSSHANRTGSWRVERPVYVDRLPPCNDACPAGEDIQGWLYQSEPGDYEAAWRQLVEDNPFPAVMGRICYHPCETSCNRVQLDEAVGINAVERFLGDHAIERGWSLPAAGPDSGKRVLVVGAGPAGLSATYHLKRLGHSVSLVDSAPKLGGMMRYGIPAYRLPRAVLDAEIARIVALGVDVVLDHTVDDIRRERDEGASTPSSLPSVPSSDGVSTSRPVTRPVFSTPSRSSTRSPTTTRPCSGGGWSSTAAGTPHSTPPARRAVSVPPTRSSSTAVTGIACPLTGKSSKKRSTKGSRCAGSPP